MKRNGFIAYPDSPPIIGTSVLECIEIPNRSGLTLVPWKTLSIVGFKLDTLIRDQINDAAVLVADITYPNANVFYELGYAIALEKPIVPTVNVAIDRSVQRIQKTGLFDTIGWATYTNADELAEKLNTWNDISWTNTFARKRNFSQPLFILDTLKKIDFRNHIFHAVENSQLKYRTFDPDAIPRLTAAQAIAEVSSSAGVIVPFLDAEIVDSELHNLRASFILGLSHGFGVEALAIQYGNGPAALDYRDFITNSTFKHETERRVEDFSAQVLIWNQRASARDNRPSPGLLGELDLGSPAAENENQKLEFYFVETAEFSRAQRAEGAVVTGRKGSGKSAIYFELANRYSRNRKTCVVDLRPASHNLSEMREAILSVTSTGIFDHTIAAFWQYVMYFEIVLKLREIVLPRGRNDFAIQERIRNLETQFKLTEAVVSGDFTSRLDTAVKALVVKIRTIETPGDIRSQLTNMMFEEQIPGLRDAIISFTDFVDEIVLLFDDLDKGWPPRQIELQDVGMIKHLIEVLSKIQRDLSRRNVAFRHVIFLRSDIYEKLVEHTSDRGKYNVINVDWSDTEQLRYLLRRRVIAGIDKTQHEAAWQALNPIMKNGTEAIQRMIESSLRRPRFLIDLCERTLSFAINRGHAIVTESDVEEGLRQMSLYLVSDFGYEMRDVAGTPEDIFYPFIGSSSLLTEGEVRERLRSDRLGRLTAAETIELLLWYGFLGVVDELNDPVFIYDRSYDFRRLVAERPEIISDRLYVVNPAFLKGLERYQTARHSSKIE